MEKMLRADNLCTDILYFKNYLISLINVPNIEQDIKNEILGIIKSSEIIFKQYSCFSAVQFGKVIKDFNSIREQVTKLHLSKSDDKELIMKYQDLCFFLSETKSLYYSGLAI